MWTRVRIVKYSFVPLTWSPRIHLSDGKKKQIRKETVKQHHEYGAFKKQRLKALPELLKNTSKINWCNI